MSEMKEHHLKAPVAFLVFNRPDTTTRVFEAIRVARPPKLLIVADGPRADKPGEAERCAAVRRIIDGVDWPCEVLKNYSDINLGCKRRVSSGLDWVFNTVEEAIILEDDCLPHPTFFRFCEELLDRYRDDERVAMISGDNFQFGKRRTEYSYYFSIYPHIWGWASWRRTWKLYDVGMRSWPEIRNGRWLSDIFGDGRTARYWSDIFERTYRNEIDTWDHQLTFALCAMKGLVILPNINLVANIGFGAGASHTGSRSFVANLPVEPMVFPLQHPPFMARDTVADHFTHGIIYDPGFLLKVRLKLGLASGPPAR
jgi:hypothetical protein